MKAGAGEFVQGIRERLHRLDHSLSGHTWYRVARNTLLGFNRQGATRKAAAMTYFAVFSVFPFILLLIALLSFAIDTREAQQRVISLLSGFFPAGTAGVQQVIEEVISQRGVAAGFGIVLLLWGAIGWFENIDLSVNEMWGVHGGRPFLRGKLFDVAMISGIALVMLLSWGASIAIGVLYGIANDTGVNLTPGTAALWEVVVWAVSLGLMFLVFLLLYRFSPMCDLTWRDVWRGALITAFLWSLVRSGFAIYVTHFANFSSAYGPLAAVIAFLTWLYVAHIVILFGAALTYAMRLDAQGIRELRPLPCATPEQGAAQEGQQERDRPAA